MSGYNIIKIIQLFLIGILFLEIISFISGYGTHFETHKFYILIFLLIFNSIIPVLFKKNK